MSNMEKWMTRYGPFAARVLVAQIFLISGLTKALDFGATKAYLSSAGVAAPGVLLVLATLIEIVGGLALLLGAWSRGSAWLLALYLVPVTFVMHRFWEFSGVEAQQQQVEFMKNLAIMGGLLGLTTAGAGELSLEHRHPKLFERLSHSLHRSRPHTA